MHEEEVQLPNVNWKSFVIILVFGFLPLSWIEVWEGAGGNATGRIFGPLAMAAFVEGGESTGDATASYGLDLLPAFLLSSTLALL